MGDHLQRDEVALLIKARQLLKAKGLSKDADIKRICESAGVSRKTGYQWAKDLQINGGDPGPEEELARLKAEHEELKKRFAQVDFENEGRKLAWEIHEVDKLLAAKKNTIQNRKKKKQ
jgi:transposase